MGITKDGQETNFLTSKIPLINETGEAYGILGISYDITSIKQKEKELRNLIDVTSLQNKKLLNFAHIVSHNLRSHSANFSMLLEFLQDEQDELEKNNIMAMLFQSSENLMETLGNLNEVLDITTKVNIRRKTIDITQKIRTVTQNLQAFLKKEKAVVHNSVPEGTQLFGIPDYIENILMNLITNAVKYAHNDRTPVISISAKTEDEHTVISIKDNGLGIDLKKYKSKLFGMYKTFHKHDDAKGIGLYITKNQMEP